VQVKTDLAAEVFRVVGRFRRQLRRSVGRGFDSARLTESQSELLWLVGRKPGISVSAAAAELGLVPNTASTLVSKLVSRGLLTRSVGASDRRVGGDSVHEVIVIAPGALGLKHKLRERRRFIQSRRTNNHALAHERHGEPPTSTTRE